MFFYTLMFVLFIPHDKWYNLQQKQRSKTRHRTL